MDQEFEVLEFDGEGVLLSQPSNERERASFEKVGRIDLPDLNLPVAGAWLPRIAA